MQPNQEKPLLLLQTFSQKTFAKVREHLDDMANNKKTVLNADVLAT
jgi:hypothetical protein